jgi:hypothetical protein
MPAIFWVSSAGLVGVLGFLLVRLFTGRTIVRKPLEGLSSAAIVILLVGWPAVQWLQAGHPDATETRYIAVWVQAFSAFGIAALMLLGAWLSRGVGLRSRPQ